MTSLLWLQLYLEHNQSVQYFPQQISFTALLLNISILNEGIRKYRHVWQTNVTSLNVQIDVSFFNTSSKFVERIDCCDWWVGHRHNLAAGSFFINNIFSATRKLLTPNIYCSSREPLVCIHRMHLRINAICSKSFSPQKTNNGTLFVAGSFQRQWLHI